MAAYTNTTLVADTTDVAPYLGANVSAAYSVTMQDDVGLDAEAFICILTRYDWVTNFAAVGTIEKRLLSEYVCRAMAIAGIAYDMSGFTSRIEAEDMINVHIHRMGVIERLLADQKAVTFIQAGVI